MGKPDKSNSLLHHPFDNKPELGQLKEVAKGVYWLRMPLPFSLDHINLWMLQDDDGWTLIDTGIANDETIEIWQNLYRQQRDDRPIKRIVVTHMHPDHIGLAGWLVKRCKAELWMSRADYLTCQHLLSYSHEEAPEEALQFYRAAGFDEDQIEMYNAQFGGFGQFVRALPHSFVNMKEGDEITIGGNRWQVLMGYGHSVEHVCLYCEALNVFISGDQLLPTISSNVSLRPTEPKANPLEEWIESCQRLSDRLNMDTLVLPAHGRPFTGAPSRFGQMLEEHEKDLKKLLAFCDQPRTAMEAFPVLFRAKITRNNLIMAIGESLAHFNCLLARGQVSRSTGADGVHRYLRV